ncbi:hypothetical protein F2P81_010516 [Scophthalmus maximus]|uniref:Uncharacterized protein n=1 Tax=Scophthalmus maximus TaxID=52904 RepID=A0A6A4T613_SCOMX|nr:hypothetical protein F2P81_010516 [Scophthalmus maximus]
MCLLRYLFRAAIRKLQQLRRDLARGDNTRQISERMLDEVINKLFFKLWAVGIVVVFGYISMWYKQSAQVVAVEPPERATPERRGVQGNATGTFTLPGWYTSSQAARVERNAPGEYDTDLNHGQDCGSNPDLTQR